MLWFLTAEEGYLCGFVLSCSDATTHCMMSARLRNGFYFSAMIGTSSEGGWGGVNLVHSMPMVLSKRENIYSKFQSSEVVLIDRLSRDPLAGETIFLNRMG